MKTCLKMTFSIVAALSLFLGCTTTSEKYYGNPEYSKTDPKNIEFLIDYPSRPYTEIGEIKGKGAALYTNDKDVKDAIRETAAEMGADAVVLRGKAVKYDYWGLNNERKALAIKWKPGSSAPSNDKTSDVSSPASSSSGGLPVPQPVH